MWHAHTPGPGYAVICLVIKMEFLLIFLIYYGLDRLEKSWDDIGIL